jgi:magnesium-transporting ATPase (P-type)
MDEDNFIILHEFDEVKKYKLLDMFEFDSDRKRMSVIVQDEAGKITLFCKGADSIMIPRYHEEKKGQFKETIEHLEEFAAIGLRTLLLGAKELSRPEYEKFKADYDVAQTNRSERRTTSTTEKR